MLMCAPFEKALTCATGAVRASVCVGELGPHVRTGVVCCLSVDVVCGPSPLCAPVLITEMLCAVLLLVLCCAAVMGSLSTDFIKSHYKAAALKLHPDKHIHSDEATQRRSVERFRRLQVAYEVLKDAEKRRAYDQGRLVH